MITSAELEVLLLKAGGAALGTLLFIWIYRIVRGRSLR